MANVFPSDGSVEWIQNQLFALGALRKITSKLEGLEIRASCQPGSAELGYVCNSMGHDVVLRPNVCDCMTDLLFKYQRSLCT